MAAMENASVYVDGDIGGILFQQHGCHRKYQRMREGNLGHIHFDDMAAMENVSVYINVLNDKEKIQKGHPPLESCVKVTEYA